MAWIFVDKEEEGGGMEKMRQQMRRNMRGGGYRSGGGYRGGSDGSGNYRDGYRQGYKHGWEANACVWSYTRPFSFNRLNLITIWLIF